MAMSKRRSRQQGKQVVKVDGLTVLLPEEPPSLNPEAARILLGLLLDAARSHRLNRVSSENADE